MNDRACLRIRRPAGFLVCIGRMRPIRSSDLVRSRRWSSNPSGKCSSERPTRGTVCGTMRSMCGADAGCLAINYQSLSSGKTSPVSTVESPAHFCTGTMINPRISISNQSNAARISRALSRWQRWVATNRCWCWCDKTSSRRSRPRWRSSWCPSTQTSAPSTLHPAPCTLHPAPCTLHTLNHKP